MGRAIFKTARDRDLYMEWSSNVEAPTFIGTRSEMAARISQEPRYWWWMTTPEKIESLLRRADENGSTTALDGLWDDDELIVEQRGTLPRDRYVAFAETYPTDPQQAYLLLEPLDDEPGDDRATTGKGE